MREIEIQLPDAVAGDVVGSVIDNAIAQSGLTVTLRDTLKKFPGCVHWHVKEGRAAGTLEITFLPKTGRAWFTIQSGWRAAWIDAKMTMLQRIISRGK